MKSAMKLITIVTEGILKNEVAKLIMHHGASGYTVSNAQGTGSRGTRTGDWEGPNQKFEAIVTAEVADAILANLGENYFRNYAMVAWTTDVHVLRGEKFGKA